MIIEITTHGSSLKRNHDSFVIQNNEQKTEWPAEKIDAIIISANSVVSTQAIKLAMEKQIQMVFANWSGQPFARVWTTTPGKATDLRRWQYVNQVSSIGLTISNELVKRKITSQKKFLTELRNNRDGNIILEESIQAINSNLSKIDMCNKDKLLGYEGYCSKQYFQAISQILPKKWQFKERSQHPALDGFNSALNYIYGIGYSDVEKIIILSGLDANAGFLHADSYGKPTLSFDLIELIRPNLDKIVVTLFTKKQVTEDWFEMQDDGVFLAKNGRTQVIAKYVEIKKQIEKIIWDYCRKIIEMYEATKS